MITETKYFGEIEYDEDELILFPRGLYGFDEETRFLLLPFSEAGGLFSLQSAATPQLAFVVMNPFALDPDYAPVLLPEELKELEAERSEELFYYAMCVVREPVGESTLNLKCPLAINGETRKGMQVILEGDLYRMRHRLDSFGAQGGELLC